MKNGDKARQLISEVYWWEMWVFLTRKNENFPKPFLKFLHLIYPGGGESLMDY